VDPSCHKEEFRFNISLITFNETFSSQIIFHKLIFEVDGSDLYLRRKMA
jgi:hypothetical protein